MWLKDILLKSLFYYEIRNNYLETMIDKAIEDNNSFKSV